MDVKTSKAIKPQILQNREITENDLDVPTRSNMLTSSEKNHFLVRKCSVVIEPLILKISESTEKCGEAIKPQIQQKSV
ncbi:unnamed protein product, partial [Brachionus calyciflorus]